MSIDISNLSARELADLKGQIDQALEKAKNRERKEAMAAVHALARERGFDLNELINSIPAKEKRKGRNQDPRFRNPENPEETWSGIGRRPGWASQLHEQGRLEEARIAS